MYCTTLCELCVYRSVYNTEQAIVHLVHNYVHVTGHVIVYIQASQTMQNGLLSKHSHAQCDNAHCVVTRHSCFSFR